MRYEIQVASSRKLGFLGGQYTASHYPEIERLINTINNVSLPVAPGYAKFPGHTPVWNVAMDMAALTEGWGSQPYIDPREKRVANWKGDFEMTMNDGLRVLVEIELGNAASAFRDLAKFELGRKVDSFDFFMLGVPGPKAKEDIAYATSLDEIISREELYKLFKTPRIIFEMELRWRLDLEETEDPDYQGDGGQSIEVLIDELPHTLWAQCRIDYSRGTSVPLVRINPKANQFGLLS